MKASKIGFSKHEIMELDGYGDYRLWKQNMYSLLVQQYVVEGIFQDSKYPENYLTTALKVWKKLDEFFLMKSLSSRISLKVQLFGFKMDTS